MIWADEWMSRMLKRDIHIITTREHITKIDYDDNLKAKEVKYHTTCKKRFVSVGSRADMKESATYAQQRESAFSQLILYLDNEIFHRSEGSPILWTNWCH